MTQTAIGPVLLSRRDAAALLQISVRMLDRLVKAGDIAPVRLGDRVLFLRESLERFARRSARSTRARRPALAK